MSSTTVQKQTGRSIIITHVIIYRMQDYLKLLTSYYFVMVVTIIAAAIALWATSKFIVSRLEALQNNIKLVEEGKLEVMVQSKDQDEIGQLIISFGHMINRIKILIEEVYESKLAQKNYEMRALQSNKSTRTSSITHSQ